VRVQRTKLPNFRYQQIIALSRLKKNDAISKWFNIKILQQKTMMMMIFQQAVNPHRHFFTTATQHNPSSNSSIG
jgi:hypothetical protein